MPVQVDQMQNEALLLSCISPCPSVLPGFIGCGRLEMVGGSAEILGIHDRPVLLTQQSGLPLAQHDTEPLGEPDVRALALSMLEAIKFMQVSGLYWRSGCLSTC